MIEKRRGRRYRPRATWLWEEKGLAETSKPFLFLYPITFVLGGKNQHSNVLSAKNGKGKIT